MYFVLVDYSKAFDAVDHELCSTLERMAAPRNIISLLKNLYVNQEAQVRVDQHESRWFPIGKVLGRAVRGILSPRLFNIHVLHICGNGYEERVARQWKWT